MRNERFTLRVHDVTDVDFDGNNSRGYFDVDVVGETDHWYQHLAVSNRTYRVEVGLKAESGRFCMLARSNPLTLPRDCPSDCDEERWSTIDVA